VARGAVTIYYWLVFGVSIGVGICIATLLWLVTLPFDRQRRAVHALIAGWGFQYMRVWPLWRVRVEHRERIPEGPCVIIANHQSMADIIAVLGLYSQFKFVSKASLFKVPVLGALMKMAKYVSVERGKPKSMHDMMDACRGWLKDGMSVMIFPEGTYAPDHHLLPFKSGAFVLAIEQQVPIVPVVLDGTPGLIHEDGPWMSPRARIGVSVQEPLMPETFGADPEALARRVRQLYVGWTSKEAIPSAPPVTP
jgi:1-acyl-sn-glycerol-3-phosphate acyltransferase